MDKINLLPPSIIESFLYEMVVFFTPFKWMFLLAFIIVLCDLRFGLMAARKRQENIRFSRAIRRTGNKIVDYFCWIILAAVFGEVFGSPFGINLLPPLILLVIFGCEINSCFSNYFEYKGKDYKVNIFRFFSRKTDIIEPEIDTERKEKKPPIDSRDDSDL